MIIRILPFLAYAAAVAAAPPPCVVKSSRAEFKIAHTPGQPRLNLDERSDLWKHAARQKMWKDCSKQLGYREISTVIRAFWTDTDLYFLFRCPYKQLNCFRPSLHASPRVGLWDRDVVEIFLGDDWQNIRHYREFEIAPTGDWIDLAINLDEKENDYKWRSGWETLARIDEAHKIWYAAARIPLTAISTQHVNAGTKWRMNLYRIDGLGADPVRHFLCWQPTCVKDRDPNHVPEHFGTLILGR